MKKYLIAILIIIFLISSFAFQGCRDEAEEMPYSLLESAETSAKATVQTDAQLTETAQITTSVVMPITPEEVYEIISQGKDHFLIDVRTPEEYSSGYIEGAALIPVGEIESRLDEIPRDKQIIVYCRSGNRSRTAANILIENGFDRVYDMGGIADWQAKGYPVITEQVNES